MSLYHFYRSSNYHFPTVLRQAVSKTSLANCELVCFRCRSQVKMAECVTRVELHISCRGLLDKDTTSKSDPLCALYIQDAHGKWVEVSCYVRWLDWRFVDTIKTKLLSCKLNHLICIMLILYVVFWLFYFLSRFRGIVCLCKYLPNWRIR